MIDAEPLALRTGVRLTKSAQATSSRAQCIVYSGTCSSGAKFMWFVGCCTDTLFCKWFNYAGRHKTRENLDCGIWRPAILSVILESLSLPLSLSLNKAILCFTDNVPEVCIRFEENKPYKDYQLYSHWRGKENTCFIGFYEMKHVSSTFCEENVKELLRPTCKNSLLFF